MYEKEISELLTIATTMEQEYNNTVAMSSEAIGFKEISERLSATFTTVSNSLSSAVKWVVPSFLVRSDYDKISGDLRKTTADYDKGVLVVKHGSKKRKIEDFMSIRDTLVIVPPGTITSMPVVGEGLVELYDGATEVANVADELYAYTASLVNSRKERNGIRPPKNVSRKTNDVDKPIKDFLETNIGNTAIETVSASKAYGNIRGIAYSMDFAHTIAKRTISKPSASLHKSMSDLSEVVSMLAKKKTEDKDYIEDRKAVALLNDVRALIALSSRVSTYWYLCYEYMNTNTHNIKIFSTK